MRPLHISENSLSLKQFSEFIFHRDRFSEITFSQTCAKRITASYTQLCNLLERRVPVYGVNTGFGDSLFRTIPLDKAAELQRNLIAYLSCGTGPKLPRHATRAALLSRLYSLSRGYSGVSFELIQTMAQFLERDWLPVVPAQGSLGASGDLVPLAYIGAMLQGQGEIETPQGVQKASDLFREYGVQPYSFKPKEALAIVNGTSMMSGLALLNYRQSQELLRLSGIAAAWLCLALQGRVEAFGTLINESAKSHPGQSEIARQIREILDEETHSAIPFHEISVEKSTTSHLIQDRYSLRCTPQVLGPIAETLQLIEGWLEREINSVSDNPLIDGEGNLATGGNFYGGYLGHGMDYLKICLGHMADLMDRQLAYVIDDKSNRGLPANLANWPGLPESERFLHHGLKGLHQSMSAITSEVLAKTLSNGIFSRSSESHNQDKVSLGMSAAVQCSEVIQSVYTLMAIHLTCLAQALDLRGIQLKGTTSQLYQQIRRFTPFVERDMALDQNLESLRTYLLERSYAKHLN